MIEHTPRCCVPAMILFAGKLHGKNNGIRGYFQQCQFSPSGAEPLYARGMAEIVLYGWQGGGSTPVTERPAYTNGMVHYEPVGFEARCKSGVTLHMSDPTFTTL